MDPAGRALRARDKFQKPFKNILINYKHILEAGIDIKYKDNIEINNYSFFK
jgi:hypothetical protein